MSKASYVPVGVFAISMEELVHRLEESYPHRCAQLTDIDREVWFKAGQRSVVDFVRSLLEPDEET